jgi:hypothetical protein
MEAIRIRKIVTDDRVEEIKKFLGKRVEIIILPEIMEEESENNDKKSSIFSLKGKMKRSIDGLEYQKKIRQEWDNRL